MLQMWLEKSSVYLYEEGRLPVLLLFLSLAAFRDLQTRTIPCRLLAAGAITALLLDLCGITSGRAAALSLLPSLLPGVFYLLMGLISGAQIGQGDGLTILVLGLFAGLADTVLITAAAQFACAVCAGLMLAAKKADRNTRLPFVPFLLAAAAGLYLKGGRI